MSTSSDSNNERLRDLVSASGLSEAVALTLFNRGLGAAACSVSVWKAYLAEAGSARLRPLSDELLAHAKRAFAEFTVKA